MRQHTSPDPHTSIKITHCDLQGAGVGVLPTQDITWLAIKPCHLAAVDPSYGLQRHGRN